MKNKILILSVIIISIFILYILSSSKNIIKKQEKFYNDIPITTNNAINITNNVITIPNDVATSYSITTQLANLLNISSRRITNLAFSKEIINGQINIFFNILEYNFLEKHTGEIDLATAQQMLQNLTAKKQIIININGNTVLVNYITDPIGLNTATSESLAYSPNAKYFNNTKLLDIANYAKQVYDTIPNDDDTMTKFLSLGIDSDSMKVIIKN